MPLKQLRSTSGRRSGLWILLLLVPLAVHAEGAAEPIQLSAGSSFSTLKDIVVSPNGRWVTYVQDALVDDEDVLWVVPARGGTPQQVSPAGTTGLATIRFSEDSEHVVFLARTTGEDQLFSNSVTGSVGTAVALSSGEEVSNYRGPSGSGDRLVYIELEAGLHRRYTVPIQGPVGARTQLAIAADTDDGRTWLSPDGNWVLFSLAGTPIFSLDLATPGASPVQVEPPFTGFDRLEIFPDSSRILLSDDFNDLHSIPISGPNTSAVRLTDGQEAFNQKISPDGQWVVFGDFPTIYSVPSNGPATDIEILDSTLGASGGSIGPNSTTVFLQPSTPLGVPRELWVAPIDGTLAPVQISGSVSGTAEGVLAWAASAEAGYIVMQESRLGAGISAGYRRPLVDPLSSSDLVWTLLITAEDWEINPAGTEILLHGTLTNSGDVDERLWTATLNGPPSLEELILNEADLPDGLLIDSAFYGPTGDIFFSTRASERGELFVIPGPIFEDGFEQGNTGSWSGGSGG